VRITRNCLFDTQTLSNLREFKQNRVRWVHPPETISTIWLVNRILAAVIISFLPRFCVWQFSAVQDSFTDYLLCVSSDKCVANSRQYSHECCVILTSMKPNLNDFFLYFSLSD